MEGDWKEEWKKRTWRRQYESLSTGEAGRADIGLLLSPEMEQCMFVILVLATTTTSAK
jgi:hypothetical protein